MIVQRNTFRVKPGKQPEIIEMMKAAHEMLGSRNRSRIYTSNIGPFQKIVNDIEFESLAQVAEYWEDWWSREETPAFMEKWNQLIESGGGAEIWNVEE